MKRRLLGERKFPYRGKNARSDVQSRSSGTGATSKQRRKPVDRRSENDRRAIDDPDFMGKTGYERRHGTGDRRQMLYEQRQGWIRVSQWSSACVDAAALFY